MGRICDANGVCTFILICCHIISVSGIYALLQCIINKLKMRYTVFNFIFNLIILFKMLTFLDCMQHSYTFISCSVFAQNYMAMPVFIHILILSAEIVVTVYDLYKIREWQINHVTLKSIKEGSDKLPMGICCFTQDGRPQLVNHKMNDISINITGEALFDANEFWRRISTGDVINGSHAVQTGENPVIEFPDGNVRSFVKNKKDINGETIYEIITSDITVQYGLSRKLSEYNSDLRKVNRRLEIYSENLLHITRDKEILAAKISIHDKLGKALLATKRYIETNGKSTDKDSLLMMWRNNIALLRNEEHDTDNSLDDLYAAADVMGIKLKINGNIPFENNQTMRFLMAGARESLTNAVHHAKAENLFITVRSKGQYNIIEYRNDGNIPFTDEIKEGGGLSSLRKDIENTDGKMEVFARPEFLLRLTIPK